MGSNVVRTKPRHWLCQWNREGPRARSRVRHSHVFGFRQRGMAIRSTAGLSILPECIVPDHQIDMVALEQSSRNS